MFDVERDSRSFCSFFSLFSGGEMLPVYSIVVMVVVLLGQFEWRIHYWVLRELVNCWCGKTSHALLGLGVT